MNILVISQYWSPENGVPQRRWAWLTRQLVEAGHTVLVLAPPPHYRRKVGFVDWVRASRSILESVREEGANGEEIVRTPFFPAGSSLTSRIFSQASIGLGAVNTMLFQVGRLGSFRPDVVIGTVPALPTALVALIAGHRFKVPYLIDLRDSWPELLKEARNWNKINGNRSFREKVLSKGPLQTLTFVTEIVVNCSLSRARKIIVTSDALRDWIVCGRLRGEARSPDDVVVIRNVFPPAINWTKVPNKRSSAPLRVLYAGTIGRAQNLANALTAASLAKQRGTEVEVRFVGAGDGKASLIHYAGELDIQAEFLPQGSTQTLQTHYDWADTALVHLTDWAALRMAVPSKTYELMAVGLHITGVVEGESKKLIETLGAGHVVPQEDPISLATLWCRLSANRELLVTSRRAKAWVEQERLEQTPAALKKAFALDGKT